MTADTQTTLLLKTDDIARLTSISGNLDIDQAVPFIYIAQRNEIKRILGIPLYEKILVDFENDTLSGTYLTIYTDFVVDMLTYFSASNIIKFTPYKVTNAGVYRTQPENGVTVEFEELVHLTKDYYALGNNLELMFVKWIKDNPVPEYPNDGCCTNHKSSYGFNWYL